MSVDNRYTGVGYEPPFETPSDKDFMAAHIEELDSRVRELEAERDRQEKVYAVAVQDRTQLAKQLDDMESERDRLKAENEGLKGEILLSTVPLHEHQELRARHAALVEAAEKSNLTFYKMLHHFAGNLDYPKEYRKYIEQLSSELKAALAEVKP